MIPQPFAKGGGERVYFGPYEYPPNADIVFDFGNPTCTSAFDTSRIVYNVGTANITGSLIPYANPSNVYPLLESNYGGTAVFRYIEVGTKYNYVQWDWQSTENETSVFVYLPNGDQSSTSQYFPGSAGESSISTQFIYPNARVYVNIADSSNNINYDVFGVKQFETGSANGRNGWNIFGVSANSSNNHTLYVNQTTASLDTTNITRTTSGTQTTKFPVTANARIMAYLQYPRVLKPKEIRQIYKVFSSRFFT